MRSATRSATTGACWSSRATSTASCGAGPKPGRVFTRDELLDRSGTSASDSFDRTVDAHIKTLRAKLKAVAPELEAIRTLRGTGYALSEELAARRP